MRPDADRVLSDRARRYQRRRALGLCGHCGRKPVPGKKTCHVHLARQQNLLAKRRAAGRCPACGGRRRAGRVLCAACTDYRARRHARMRAAGLCLCGRQAGAGNVCCPRCCERSRRWWEVSPRRRANLARLLAERGRCADCQSPRGGGRGCVGCADYRRERARAIRRAWVEGQKARGLCVACKKPAGAGRTYCPDHRATRVRFTATYHKKKKAAGLCFVCGKRPLVNQSQCAWCRDRANAVKRLKKNHLPFRAKIRAAGRCLRCRKRHGRDTVYCLACHRWQYAQQKKRRAARTAAPATP